MTQAMRMKIRTKIIASTVLVVSFSLILSGFFIYDYAKDIIREQSIKDSRTKLAQISFQLKKIQEQVVKTAEYIVSDEEITELISMPTSENIEVDYFRKQAVQEKLRRFVALSNYILNVVIISPDQDIYSNFSGYEEYFHEYLKQDWFVKIKNTRAGYSEPHPFFFISGNRQVFSYALKYRPIGQDSSVESYLVIDIAYSELSNVFMQSAQDFEQIELFTESGALLLVANDTLPESDRSFMADVLHSGLSYMEDDNRIVLTDDVMNQGWKQAALLSKNKLFMKINRVFFFYIIIIISGIIVTLVVMLPIIVNLTKPLIRLTNAMKRVAVGDLNTSVQIRSGDELEILGTGFNRMVEDLRNMMETSVRNEAVKRQMQIDLLMAQINPHFLYNSLNTVIYLSHANRGGEAAEVTQALISILQNTIKTGEGAVRAPLSEEKRIIDKYAVIQQTRYPESFHLVWEVDEVLLSRSVPRMALQPLVENAIIHGIIPSDRETGTITVRAYREVEQLILEVEDDGQGMSVSEDGWKMRVGQGQEPERTRGIGLSNIQERMHTHFGASARLEVYSQLGQGTLVRIRLPWTESDSKPL
ncbi:sensor histidine kinase [Paenibacillus sp. 2TAB23]|uniref:cache domain-containing sensor histidine kinase n=1 Tax=Paenibacillus sp. 2TAB23 TaxID=3233004 RepID=UPI003F9B24B5